MRVLYVNHTGQVSGGEKSLLELLRALPSRITPIVACPEGPLVSAVSELGVQQVLIPGTNGSLKLHPRHTPEAVWGITRGALAVRAAAQRYNASVIHANSIRAGIFATLAARREGPPTVVHLRDRLPCSTVSGYTLRLISRADVLVANSRYTAASLDEAGVTRTRRVIGNPVDLVRFDPDTVDRRAARRALGLSDGDHVSTVLAQITPWKGQEEAIRAIARVRERHPQAKLLLAGSAKFVSKATRYDNRAYLEGLHRLVAQLGLQNHVRFLGERDDVPSLLRATDALLVPSWEEPFGRSVIEAMAMRVPVIATDVGGPAEVIVDRKNGILVPPRRPDLWARAICGLVESPALNVRLARNGRLRAHAFSANAHVEAVEGVYRHALGKRRPGVAEADRLPALPAARAA